MLDEVLDPLAKSRPRLDQLPTELRRAVEQMWWRAEAPKRGSPSEPEVEIGPCPRHLPLFLLPPAPVGKQVAIQKTKGAFARFWKGISRNYLNGRRVSS